MELDVVNLDMKEKKEHKSEAFLKINPFGKVPVLVDDGLPIVSVMPLCPHPPCTATLLNCSPFCPEPRCVFWPP